MAGLTYMLTCRSCLGRREGDGEGEGGTSNGYYLDLIVPTFVNDFDDLGQEVMVFRVQDEKEGYARG